MQAGAIGMVDALGFKGSWERHPAEAVVERLRALQKHISDLADSATKRLSGLAGPHQLRRPPQGTALFLSDTIVIALQAQGFDQVTNQRMLQGIRGAMTAFVLKAVGLVVAGGVHHQHL